MSIIKNRTIRQIVLRFVVLVHFVDVRFWVCGLPAFEKQEVVTFLGASCFLRTFPFGPSICRSKWSFLKKNPCLFGKKKVSGEDRPNYMSCGVGSEVCQSQIAQNYIDHDHIGHNYIGHSYIGRNDIGHNYIGHNYIGHNYMN